ncbi:hypothetical protein cce_1594 [Crocosphaera subtropica ATCC 51142]|uniref:Uncharacterized protein n=1 Tax=Crocosphaera subtropica (strain ATCC 51142 / BH68) TaxID=43989 RepID=B1WXV7_CROS5|nr:hypothetical protein [Crocosphaera subtropica]ACB50944.1 hypothetical protein cce_1594 [Crocosphaera subtropica ATCC 51142]
MNIPDDYYEQKQIQEQEEQKRKYQEQENEEQKLMKKKKLIKEDTEIRDNWSIKVFQLPESKILTNLSQKYLAKGTLIDDDKPSFISDYSEQFYQARDKIVSKIDQYYDQQEKELLELKEYKVFRQIYMIFLYLSGWDEYLDCKHFEESEKMKCKENFIGVKSWIDLKFSILDKLQEEGLLEQPQRQDNNRKKTTYVKLTKKGIRMTRDLLKNLDLEGVDELLEDREYHEEYLNYKTSIDLRREQE